MTRYWIKIAAGALLIFAVGMAAWFGVKSIRTVHTFLDSSDPISIPLKFVTFRVDGAALGKLERLRLLRTAPKEVTSVQITVRLDSASYADRLRGCTMRVDDVEHIDERTTFVCVTGDMPAPTGAFEQFGEVLIEGTDIVLPLFLPASAVQGFRDHGPPNPDSIAVTVEVPPGAPEVKTVPQVQVAPPPP